MQHPQMRSQNIGPRTAMIKAPKHTPNPTMIREDHSILPIQCVNTQGRPPRGMDLCRSKHHNVWLARHPVDIMNQSTRNNNGTSKKAFLEKHQMGNPEIKTGTGLEKGITRIPSSLAVSNASRWLRRCRINTHILSTTDMNSLNIPSRPLNALIVMVETAQHNLSNLLAEMRHKEDNCHTGSSNPIVVRVMRQNAAVNLVTMERALVSPLSPETLSWDNPFPSFPVNKKKSALTDADGQRPQSASSRQSQESSRSRAKHSSGQRVAGNAPSQPQETRQTSSERNLQRYPPQRLQGSGQGSGDPQIQHSATGPRPPQNIRQFEQPQQAVGPPGSDRRVEEPHPSSSAAWTAGPSQRSNTMPAEIAQPMAHSALPFRGNGAAFPMNNFDNRLNGLPAQHDILQQPVNRSRPIQNDHISSQSNEIRQDYPGQNFQPPQPTQQATDSQEEDYSDLFDSYHEPAIDAPLQSLSQNGAPLSPRDEDMPNFEALPDSRNHGGHGTAVSHDLHLQPQQRVSNTPPIGSGADRGRPHERMLTTGQPGYANRSRSQPNFKEQQQPPYQNQGFPGVPNGVPPPMPRMNGQAGVPRYTGSPVNGSYGDRAPPQQMQRPYDQAQPQYNGPPRGPPTQNPRQNTSYGGPGVPQNPHDPGRMNNGYGPSPGARASPGSIAGPALPPLADASRMDSGLGRGPGMAPSPTVRPGPSPPAPTRIANPDALPEHPAPVRPGLGQIGNPNQPPKPPPVRQYNGNPSPVPQPVSSQQPSPRRSSRTGETGPVTHEEIQGLRDTLQRLPNDQKTQLRLAQKLVEAASVLANDPDPKIRNKNREKYFTEAHRIVKKLVSHSFPEAMFYLADCYGTGMMALEVDPKEAFSLYMSAAKLGHAPSAYRVAVCCEMGMDEGGGTRRDPPKAIQWYKRAATLGDTPAMYKMGMILLKGLLGQPRNQKEAIVWLKRAAERADEENPHALHELALLYESAAPSDALVRDEGYALQLFVQAANIGYKFSQYRLGTAYEYGQLGCPVDPRQSIAWYSKAAVQEEHQSELALSGWYLTGTDGILQQSDTEAYLWARKAAMAGLAKAEYAMGYFTEVGIGAPANMDDAKRWYWKAASQNFPKARERLEDLRKGGRQMQKARVSRSAMKKQDNDCKVM
ncbi:hypothetical protein MMC30_007583 [Trapelia coarctata]|nr:hypothetical protein [Trapelia coarctata]